MDTATTEVDRWINHRGLYLLQLKGVVRQRRATLTLYVEGSPAVMVIRVDGIGKGLMLISYIRRHSIVPKETCAALAIKLPHLFNGY